MDRALGKEGLFVLAVRLRAASISVESRLGLDKLLPSSSARTACTTEENSKFCGNYFYKQLIHFSTLNPKP